ncbi:hypothetical protein AB205_0046750, partial [Aquarana catesbeiana]
RWAKVTPLFLWNAEARHLQRFWGASGDFWQAQWGKLHSYYGGNELALYCLGAMAIPSLSFWMYNAVLMMIDLTGKPSIFTRYRIQPGKNDPVEPGKLKHAVKVVLFNQVFLSCPMVLLMYPFMQWRGNPCGTELPTFHWVLLELSVFALVEEILFYYSHRLFHHPSIYKHLSNMLPSMVGPMLMGSHVATIMLWFCLALITTTISHCGYHLPFLPSPEFHDFHHLKFNQCYGVLGVLDRLHGTDLVFKQTKAYDRHILLLNFTPLTQSIPELTKKSE